MELRLNLGAYLERRQITAYRLAKEARGQVAQNTVYDLARKPARRVDLFTVGRVLTALTRLTGEEVHIGDLLEEVPEASPQAAAGLAALRLDPERPAFDAGQLKPFRYGGRSVQLRGGPKAEDIIAQERGRPRP